MNFEYRGRPIESLEFAGFCEYLKENGTQKKADFDKKITKTELKIFGLTSQQMNMLFKYFKKTGYEKLKKYPSDICYETTMLQGLLLVYENKTDLSWEEKVLNWIYYIDNWAHCDSVMSKIPIKKGEKERIFAFAAGLMGREEEFFIRCGVVILLAHFLDADYLDRIFSILSGIEYGRYYYVDMAVAWLCATTLINYKQLTLDFLENCPQINDFTYCKSLQKARESYRISDIDKAEYKEKIRKRRKKL